MTQISAFRNMVNAPFTNLPSVPMDETSARDINIIWTCIDELSKSWKGNSPLFFPGVGRDRQEFWTNLAIHGAPSTSPLVHEHIVNNDGEGKVAIDLGCGNALAIPLLLQKNWRVIAVDYSRGVLDHLERLYPKFVESKQLTLVHSTIEEYTPAEPADLVLSIDSLPHVDPARFKAVWQNIHDLMLKEEGCFIGSLFRSVPNEDELQNTVREMGAWFLPDRRMVRPLLTHAEYEIKTCQFHRDGASTEPISIHFVAHKPLKVRTISFIQNSILNTAKTWKGREDSTIKNFPANRKQFWAAFALNENHSFTPLAKEIVEASQGEGKVALDLGCGNSPAIRPLLERKWQVVAVDSSPGVIEQLNRQYVFAISSGQLKVVQSEIEEFIPEKSFDLVLAVDVLPYIDPAQFQNTWQRVTGAVKPNGTFVGTIFRTTFPESDKIFRDMGAWLLEDRRMVRPLLKHASFTDKTCRFRKDHPIFDPVCIEFEGVKV